MRRPLDAAEPARHALLTLLLDGPQHGYHLARQFAEGTVLGSVLYLSASHLYALLNALERNALIAGEREEGGMRPARRIYRLTSPGHESALRWLDEPVTRPRDVLLDFPLKLYLSRRRSLQQAVRLVERQRDLFTLYLQGLEQAAAVPEAEGDLFVALMQEGRALRTQATLDWLQRCHTVLVTELAAAATSAL